MKAFEPLSRAKRETWSYFFMKIALHTSALALVLGGLFLGEAFNIRHREEELIDSISFSDTGLSAVDDDITDPLNDLPETLVHGIVELLVSVNALYALAAILFVYGGITLLLAPHFLISTYGGGRWNLQPWLFGFEGHLPLAAIERQIFGETGRLVWSAFGSPLSRHVIDAYGDRVAVDPITDPNGDFAIKRLVKQAREAGPGEPRVFTLVDTHSMTVTLFAARRPPVAFLLLGNEGGMQRAVGCSFDWTTSTLYPETVLRMETSAMDFMDVLPRARLGLRRPHVPMRPANAKEGEVPLCQKH